MVTPRLERLVYYVKGRDAERIFMTAEEGLDADERQPTLTYFCEMGSRRMRLITITDPARRYA